MQSSSTIRTPAAPKLEATSGRPIQRGQIFAALEQAGGHERADGNIAPADRRGGQHLTHVREHPGDERDRYRQIGGLHETRHALPARHSVRTPGGQRRGKRIKT